MAQSAVGLAPDARLRILELGEVEKPFGSSGCATPKHRAISPAPETGVESQRVLERMGVSDGTTLSVRKEEGGKIRVRSELWDDAKVIGKDEVLEVRNVAGRLHIARKPRQYDEWDPYVPPYDPYGPGDSETRHVGDEAIDD